MDIPKNYFDYIYSIYGIGWTTDLDGTFQKISSYLKKDGIFIFSWHHPLNYCIAWSCDERKDVIENNTLVMNKSYFDESYFRMPVNGSEILLCNRKISTLSLIHIFHLLLNEHRLQVNGGQFHQIVLRLTLLFRVLQYLL